MNTSRSAIVDSDGKFRLGKKFKGMPLEEVPSYALGETAGWALDVARECQEELDKRVLEEREKEREKEQCQE